MNLLYAVALWLAMQQGQEMKPMFCWIDSDPSRPSVHMPGQTLCDLVPDVVKQAPAEPMDVPAVKEAHEEEYGDTNWCNACTKDAYGYNCTSMSCDPHAKHKVTIDTCADKSRILLTAEDGTKHCVKFQK